MPGWRRLRSIEVDLGVDGLSHVANNLILEHDLKLMVQLRGVVWQKLSSIDGIHG